MMCANHHVRKLEFLFACSKQEIYVIVNFENGKWQWRSLSGDCLVPQSIDKDNENKAASSFICTTHKREFDFIIAY